MKLMRTRNWVWATAHLAAILSIGALVGCEDREEVGTATPPATPTVEGVEGAEAPVAADPDVAAVVVAVPKMMSVRQGDAIHYSIAYPTGDRATSALLVEKIAPAQVSVGQPYRYQIKVTNLTDAPLAGVRVAESLGANFEFDQSQPAAQFQQQQQQQQQQGQPTTRPSQQQGAAPTTRPSGQQQQQQQQQQQTPTWMLHELAPKATETIEVTAVPTEVGQAATCLIATYTPTLCTMVEVVNPQLTLVKQGPSQAHICDPLTYTYVVSNVGTGTAQNVVVRDPLSEGLTTNEGRNEVVFEVGELEAGASRELVAQLNATRGGEFASRAIATSASGEVQSRRITTAIREPQLAVNVTGPEWKYANVPVTYNVSVTNTGEAVARDARLVLESQDLDEAARVRALGEIAPGETRTLAVTVASAGVEPVKLAALAESECAKSQVATAATSVRMIPALLIETFDNNDPVKVGQATTYTVAVKNQGNAPATNVALTAELPQELKFVEADGTTEVKAQGQKLTFGTIESLPPGEVASWIVQVEAQRSGDLRFRLQMNSDYLDQPVPEVEPTRVY